MIPGIDAWLALDDATLLRHLPIFRDWLQDRGDHRAADLEPCLVYRSGMPGRWIAESRWKWSEHDCYADALAELMRRTRGLFGGSGLLAPAAAPPVVGAPFRNTVPER